MEAGAWIDEAGVLVREGSAFFLRRDAGGRFLLDLKRVPVDEVGKQVRVRGFYMGGDLVDVEGVMLA